MKSAWVGTDSAFHPTTLTYWRRRLAGVVVAESIFEAVKTVIAATGRCRQDAAGVGFHGARRCGGHQDTVTQLIGAIRRVRREVPGASAVVAARCSAHDYDDPGKPAIAWNDAEARERLVDALVADAHRLLGYLPEQELGPSG